MSDLTIEAKARQRHVDELRDRAARLHYHDINEIKLTEDEFAALFVERELTGAAQTLGGKVSWLFLGLHVVKTGGISRGN